MRYVYYNRCVLKVDMLHFGLLSNFNLKNKRYYFDSVALRAFHIAITNNFDSTIRLFVSSRMFSLCIQGALLKTYEELLLTSGGQHLFVLVAFIFTPNSMMVSLKVSMRY